MTTFQTIILISTTLLLFLPLSILCARPSSRFFKYQNDRHALPIDQCWNQYIGGQRISTKITCAMQNDVWMAEVWHFWTDDCSGDPRDVDYYFESFV